MADKKKLTLILVNVMLVAALIVVVFPLLWIAKYNYPSADDWSFAALGYHALKNGEGLFGVLRAAVITVMEYRVSWESRFSSVFFGALQPGIWGEKCYGIVAWLMIGSIILSELYLCSSLLKKYAKDSGRWLSVSIMVPSLILQLLYTPAPEESFYWYTGAVNYTFVYGLSLVLFALFMKLGTEEFKSGGVRIGIAATACILAVIVGGDNYSTSLSSLLVLLILSVLFFFFDRRAFYRTWFVTAIVGISLWICLSAPGNMVRLNASFGGTTAGKKEAIMDSLWYARHAIYNECVDIKTVLMILLILPFLWKAVKAMDCKFRFPLLFTLITFCLYASQVTPNTYTERAVNTARLRAILFYSCYVWIVGNVGYWLGWISKRKYKVPVQVAHIYDKLGKYLLVYSILVGILFGRIVWKSGGRSFSAYESLRQGLPQQYAKEWEKRLETLHDDSVKEVYFSPISIDPGMIMYTDLEPEDGYIWVNSACARYYDKDVVRIVTEEMPVKQGEE